jgi:hypothetical protein
MTNVFAFVYLDISAILFGFLTENDRSDEYLVPYMARLGYTNLLLLRNNRTNFL